MKKIEECVNNIFNTKWEETLPLIPDNSIDIVITSPPYNVSLGIDNKLKKDRYDSYEDNMPYDDYLKWMNKCFKECYRMLKKGGRICLEGDTLISTKRGLVSIKDILIGDEVLTHKGRWKKVKDVTKSFSTDYYLLQSENSETIEITENHPIFSVKTKKCPYRENNYICRPNCPHKDNVWRKEKTTIECKYLFWNKYVSKFTQVKDLSKSDLVLMPVPQYFNNSKRVSNKMAFIIGMYLSEGWNVKKYKVNKKGQKYISAISTRFAHHIKEVSIFKKLKQYIKDEFNFECGKDRIQKNGLTTRFYNTNFGKYMEQFGCGSNNKNIPWDIYINTNIKDLLSIVIAFWYGDGSIVKIKNLSNKNYGNVVSMTTTSPLLALQIRDILYVNGFMPKIGKRKREKLTRKDAFDIILSGNDSRRFYSISKERYDIDMYGYKNNNKGKPKTYRNILDKYISYRIKKIQKNTNVIAKQYYNLEVEEDESYCVANFAVHNCINIGDGANGQQTTHADFTVNMKKIGFIPITTIVWEKSQVGNRFSWGSWCSPSQPSFPKPQEYIVLMAKETLKHEGDKSKITVTAEEFKRNSLALWKFPPETRMMKLYNHPAVFPEELPRRLIQQLTYEDDIVLDPFSGSGTTCAIAKSLKRKYIGTEMSKNYYETSLRRLGATPAIISRGKDGIVLDWMAD